MSTSESKRLSEDEFIARQIDIINRVFVQRHAVHLPGDHFLAKLEGTVVSIRYNSSNKPVMTYEMITQNWMRNTYDMVHGGCTLAIIDHFSTYCQAADLQYWNEDATKFDARRCSSEFGVSRNLTCEYVNALPANEKILLEFTLESNTKRNTYMTARILSIDYKKLYASGTHDKVKLQPKL